MKQKITYVAYDGKEFLTIAECLKYEESLKKEIDKSEAILISKIILQDTFDIIYDKFQDLSDEYKDITRESLDLILDCYSEKIKELSKCIKDYSEDRFLRDIGIDSEEYIWSEIIK